jgi:SAM-dependent methyltransferase
MTRELLIGCGAKRDKRLGQTQEWVNLTTLDISETHHPDVVHDLEILPLPFEENTFDEIHAYEVLEHTGRQGDWRFFFAQWSEFYRILKPDGQFFASVPDWQSPWALGDPGHTRIVMSEWLVFLAQPEYTRQVGVTPMADYRHVYRADFDTTFEKTVKHNYFFALRAIKPSRITT